MTKSQSNLNILVAILIILKVFLNAIMMSGRRMMKMRMLIGGGLIMSLVECHPKTWQATLSQPAQEVTNLHQHQCASASAGASGCDSVSDSAY